MPSIDEVVTGLLVDAIAATGRQVATALSAGHGRRRREDVEIARWFDTYSLLDRALPTLPPGLDESGLATKLRSDKVQALIHEMLAVRLSDGPEITMQRLRNAFIQSCATPYAGAIFDHLDHQLCNLVVTISSEKPQVLQQIRSESHFTRINATLEAIERHLISQEAPHDPQAEEEFLTSYRNHVAEHHGMIEPPDFERRRRVPINDLYVRPGIVEVVQLGKDEVHRSVDIFKDDTEIDRTVLLGDPGGGKTTASHALLYKHAKDPGLRIPLLVILRDFAADNPPPWSVVEFIEHRLRTFYQCPPPSGLINRLLLSGSALVVFDGLDELVDTSRRADITAIIERFCTEYPLTQVLVTSRIVGYDEARLDVRQFTILRIHGFSDKHVSEYVHKWFRQEEGTPRAVATDMAASFLEESSDIRDLRSNPLLLALMCILYRGEHSIPKSRSEVYQRCAELLFKKWDERRRIYVELRARYLIEPALRYLAYWMLTRDNARAAVTRQDLVAETAQYFCGRGFEETYDAEVAAEEFVDFCRGRAWVFTDVGTTATGSQLYTFTHRTFLEYFAGYYLASTCDTPEQLATKLAPRIARGEWDVVGQLAVQIKDRNTELGAERVFNALLTDRRRRSLAHRQNILSFLARCLSAVQPRSSIVRLLTREIVQAQVKEHVVDHRSQSALGSLITNSADSQETVANELDSQIAALVGSSDSGQILDGLELACYLPIMLTTSPSEKSPWNSFVNKNIAAYEGYSRALFVMSTLPERRRVHIKDGLFRERM